ncbi:MAG: hypothetical protein KGL39_01145 [Patescibacteria group bacterium]|nr:hypothetical protein [Patescibacteria group bacterium]
MKCVAHGGGHRCKVSGCTKFSHGKGGKCIAHGGGYRCVVAGCTRFARTNKRCIAHNRADEPKITHHEPPGPIQLIANIAVKQELLDEAADVEMLDHTAPTPMDILANIAKVKEEF